MRPSELNRLLADYLSEAGYSKTLNIFATEAAICNEQIAQNTLRKLVNRGLFASILR